MSTIDDSKGQKVRNRPEICVYARADTLQSEGLGAKRAAPPNPNEGTAAVTVAERAKLYLDFNEKIPANARAVLQQEGVWADFRTLFLGEKPGSLLTANSAELISTLTGSKPELICEAHRDRQQMLGAQLERAGLKIEGVYIYSPEKVAKLIEENRGRFEAVGYIAPGEVINRKTADRVVARLNDEKLAAADGGAKVRGLILGFPATAVDAFDKSGNHPYGVSGYSWQDSKGSAASLALEHRIVRTLDSAGLLQPDKDFMYRRHREEKP